MSLENTVLGIIERWWASRYSERHGIVTSYDPKRYLAKVTFQPEGQESGWLPVETGHIGNGYGITMGLQPGAGGAQPDGGQGGANSNQGDQVVVRFQEGDFESGKIVQRVHSDQDTPPETHSGEIIFWTKFQKSGGGTPDAADGGQGGTGQLIALRKDGSLTLEDGNGASIAMDGNGNITMKCKKLTIEASDTATLTSSGDVGIKGGGNVEIKGGGSLGLDAGSVVVQGGGDVSSGSVKAPSGQPSIPPFQVP